MVFEIARDFDMQSIFVVRAIFWLRSRVLGAKMETARRPTGLITEMLHMGWTRLAEQPNRFFVVGAACQPWQADVTFSPIAPEQFAAFAERDRVKIAWSLEAEALGRHSLASPRKHALLPPIMGPAPSFGGIGLPSGLEP